MVLNCIDFDGAERKICSDCVDELRVGIKSDILKKVGDITVYGIDESEEVREGAEETVLGVVVMRSV